MLKIIFLWVGLLPVTANVSDSTDRDRSGMFYYKAQFAGNLGLVSAGTGWDFPGRKIWLDLNLGYLPKHINDVRVFTLSVRPAWKITEFNVKNSDVGWYLGTAINYSMGRNIFGSMPDYYPLDYYWPNAFHVNPFTGLRISLNPPERKKRTYVFAELGTVDYEIWFALKNREVSITDIVNLSFGIIVRSNQSRIQKLQQRMRLSL